MAPGAPPPHNKPIKVLRIPADGNEPMQVIRVETTKITADKKLSTWAFGHIPNVEDRWNYSVDALAKRVVCFHIEKSTDPIQFCGLWMLLKSITPASGLPLNGHKYWADMPNRKVYGDAFLCCLNSPPVTGHMANYTNVPDDLIQHAGDRVKWLMRRFAEDTEGTFIELDKDKNWLGPL